MILDKGICVISHKVNAAGSGEKPIYVDVDFWRSWYGELSYETAMAWPTDRREEVRTDARVRILQCREITNHDRVTLTPTGQNALHYEVTRAYHGTDDESGELITDLNLEVVRP